MNQDGYVRLRPLGQRPLLGNEPIGPTPILFVDVEPGAEPQSLRRVPHVYLASVRAVVVRGTPNEFDKVQNVLTAAECKAPCVLLTHNVGSAATLNDTSRITHLGDIVLRVRAAEIDSLLQLGDAVWESDNFHFLLPSGRHAKAFVRLGHAIRSIQDNRVVALWLLAHVDPKGSAVIVDSDSLTSIVLALQIEAKERSIDISPIKVISRYPTTRVEAATAVFKLTENPRHLLAILSVNATGGLRDLVVSAIHDAAHRLEPADVVNLVDLQIGTSFTTPQQHNEKIKVTTLHELGDAQRGDRFQTHVANCPLCARLETAPLVPIEMNHFDALFPSFIQRQTPDIQDPRRNRYLWEACDRNENALHFENPPEKAVQIWRSTEKMTWKIDWNPLLSDTIFQQRTRERIDNEIHEFKDNQRKQRNIQAPDEWTGFDIVLVPQRDKDRPDFDAFWRATGSSLSTIEPTPFPDEGEWVGELITKIREAKLLLVFTLGTVTGTTLQRALNEIQRLRQDSDYTLYGIVIHSRPARRRTWDGLRNSYANRLLAAYLTFVPDDFSPLRDEANHLGADMPERSADFDRFFEHRNLICKGEVGDPNMGFLWGAKPAEKISAHSLFGEKLGVKATFIAVASAIHARRETPLLTPRRSVFEMPVIARSYYDPVIFTCMLRWLKIQEIWWGEKPTTAATAAEEVIASVLGRASPAQLPLLLGELLLASAQGKIPPHGIKAVRAHVEKFHDSPECATDDKAMLTYGLLLLNATDAKQKQ